MLLALLLHLALAADEAGVDPSGGAIPQLPASSAEVQLPPKPADDDDLGLLALPFGFYTPETRVGVGGAALLHFRRPGWNGELASTLRVILIFTQNEQAVAEVIPEVYFAGGRRILKLESLAQLYPDEFHGVGARTPRSAREVYTARVLRLRATGLQAVTAHTYAGIMVEGETLDVLHPSAGGELARGDARGSEGGRFVGLGPVVRYDSRNSTFLPSRGLYGEASALAFAPALGSTLGFQRVRMDLRGFTDPIDRHVLAGHVQLEGASGDVPFHQLPLFGGGRDLRGYRRGRFRDHVLAAVQGEWRLPVAGPFGAATFAGVGTVAPDLALRDLRVLPSVGAGARLFLGDREPISARLDVAYGVEGFAFYALAGEAF